MASSSDPSSTTPPPVADGAPSPRRWRAKADPASSAAARAMRALGDPGRWKIAVMLATEGPRSVKDMQKLLGWKQQRTSFHATILFDAGLVTRESAAGDGRFTIYRLTEASLAMVQAVRAWQPRLEA